MDFLRDPDHYDAASAWAGAIADVGGSVPTHWGCWPAACSDSPIAEPATLDLARRVDALDAALAGPDWVDEVRALRAELTAAARDHRRVPGARGRRPRVRCARGGDRALGERPTAARPTPVSPPSG